MAFKCPVPGCEDSEKEFQKPSALKSHIRSKHPEFMGELAREVPIVEEDFATLLMKFKVRGDLAANIAENVSHTGGSRVFEEPEILYKRLVSWSSDIPPGMRKNIIEQWFAEKGIDIPPEIQQRAGMTPDQIQKAEATAKKEDLDVRYIYDLEARHVRMAREGERGGTLAQAKELKRMAEEDEGHHEPSVVQGTEGHWMLNPSARATGLDAMAVEFLNRAQDKGEPITPLTAMTQAAETWKILREGLGVGSSASPLPAWMTDPLAFTEAIKGIAGGKGEDSEVKAAMVEMQRTIAELKEDRWRSQFEAQQKQIGELANALNKTLEAITDMKKERVGRTEMDILHDIATEGIGLAKTELPGLRRDLKEAVGSVALPSTKSPEQREDRKKKFKQAIDTDRDIEEIGRRIFFGNS